MIFSAKVSATVVVVFLSVGGCAQIRPHGHAVYPRKQPFVLEGVERGAHLTEAQAIEVAFHEAEAYGTNPAVYAAPKATFQDGEWFVFFGEPPGPPASPLGFHFAVFVYERDNQASYSAGR